MKGNLVIDVGNTRTKIAIFENEEMVFSFSTNTINSEDIQHIKSEYINLNAAIISSVRTGEQELKQLVQKHVPFTLLLDHETPLPLENKYETPKTLGKDRLAAAVGANHLFPGKNILVIDAGTAITYDYINAKKYMGGFITPGLNMRFKALNEFTDNLPLLKADNPEKEWRANTKDSIIGGVQLGIEGEIERIIEYFKQINTRNNELIIILTGGDKNYFEKILKNHKFVALEITLLGLNTILEANYTKGIENQKK